MRKGLIDDSTLMQSIPIPLSNSESVNFFLSQMNLILHKKEKEKTVNKIHIGTGYLIPLKSIFNYWTVSEIIFVLWRYCILKGCWISLSNTSNTNNGSRIISTYLILVQNTQNILMWCASVCYQKPFQLWFWKHKKLRR